METQLQRLAGKLTAGLLIALAQCVRGNVPSQTLSLLLPQAGVQSVNPEVTLISGSEVYLSTQPGARNTGALNRSAAAAGSFADSAEAKCEAALARAVLHISRPFTHPAVESRSIHPDSCERRTPSYNAL